MIEWINTNETLITLVSTLSLVAITGIYVFLTKRLLDVAVKQSKLSYNPVVGITLGTTRIGKVFGDDRRNMGVGLSLTNVGNAPAIDVIVDAEIIYNHINLNGETCIPARFSPSVIPFIRPGEDLKEGETPSPNFGNTSITLFFNDVLESNRLNDQRISTKSLEKPYNASKLRIIVYYRNNLEQYFESIYEAQIYIEKSPVIAIPEKDEQFDILTNYFSNPNFKVQPISKKMIDKKVEERDAKRYLSGW